MHTGDRSEVEPGPLRQAFEVRLRGVGSLGDYNSILSKEVVSRVPGPGVDLVRSGGAHLLIRSGSPYVTEVLILSKQEVMVQPHGEETGLHPGD